MNRLVVIGASGHGKVVVDIALKLGYKNILFIDDNVVGEFIGFPIVGKSEDLEQLNDESTDFILAIGNNKIRKRISEQYKVNWVTIVHPSAQVSAQAIIGQGTLVGSNAVINAGAKVGRHCIINTGAIVEHDDSLSDYVHLSPNAALGGTVCIGEGTHVGIGATVINNVNICSNCIIGAGAVVVNDLTREAIYIGIPAKEMKSTTDKL